MGVPAVPPHRSPSEALLRAPVNIPPSDKARPPSQYDLASCENCPVPGDNGLRRRAAKKNILIYQAGSYPPVELYICTVAFLAISCVVGGGGCLVQVSPKSWLTLVPCPHWVWRSMKVRYDPGQGELFEPELPQKAACPHDNSGTSLQTPAVTATSPCGQMFMVTDHHSTFFLYLTHMMITFWCLFFLGRFHFAYLCVSDVWSIRRNAI